MTMIKCIVVDDEPIARAILENYITQIPYLEKVASCKNAFEAMEIMNNQVVDLVLLDINMPRLTGMEMLRTMKRYPSVIITSAYPQFALEGFELEVADYLLKPFSFARFVQATEKVLKAKNASGPLSQESRPEPEDYIMVKSDKKLLRIAINSIDFVEAYGNYIFIHRGKEKLISKQTLTTFEAQLPADRFIRVHKSFLVQLASVGQLEGNEISIGGNKIPVGKVFRENLVSRFR